MIDDMKQKPRPSLAYGEIRTKAIDNIVHGSQKKKREIRQC